jgi:BirA family transcriptional regulator, biotin operon repressor / biotin---[acetyl-CoA-carboxylase] ligase
MNEFFDRELFETLRTERGVTWGRPLRLFESTSSTNDRALEALSQGMKTGGVFVAREQTQGRGRRGAPWQSPPGENLTFSVVLRVPVAAWALPNYTLVVGLALSDALESRISAEVSWGIKWPNDIYVRGQKLAGILVEGRQEEAELALAVGIGLNVDTLDFGDDKERRVSLRLLAQESGGKLTPELGKESLVLDILKALETRTRSLVSGGFERCLPDIRKRDVLRGAPLRERGQVKKGAGLAEDGALLVTPLDGGPIERVVSGSIEFPLEAPAPAGGPSSARGG